MSGNIDPKSFDKEQQELLDLGAIVLKEAKTQGATAAELSLSIDEGLSVKVRNEEVDTVEHSRDKGLGVTVYFGQRKGSASSSDFGPEALKQTVRAATSIAKYTSEDEYSGLADANLMASTLPDLDLSHPWHIEAAEAIEMGCAMESAAKQADTRISKTGAVNIGRHQGVSVYCNSHGFFGVQRGTHHSLSCSMIAGEGAAMQRGSWYSLSRSPEMLDSYIAVGELAAKRAVARLGAKSIATGHYPVLFSPEMTRGLLSSFISSISGSALYRKSTFMLDKLGEQVFSENIRLSEQPLLAKALGSSSFDRDGLSRKPKDIVKDGVLQSYILSVYSARKLNMMPTANAGGVRNLTLHPGDLDEDALLKTMGRGFYVTEMMGQGARLTTGDYSRGAAGFWVEDGEVVHAVQEVTIAGNLAEMFKNIVEVGSNMDVRGNIRTPSILIGNMMVAGK